jgi:hypothetical protein
MSDPSISLTITTGTKCVQSGRVCVFPKTVTLNGGRLVDAMRFLRFACNLAARFLAALIREGFLN